MRQYATTADPPTGYVEDWNKEIWNVGHVFMWSTAFKNLKEDPEGIWIRKGHITVKPGDTIAKAFERELGEPMFPNYNVFFVEEK